MFDLSVCLFVYMPVCLYVCLSEVTIQLELCITSVIKLSVQFSVMGGTHTGEILPVSALPNHSVLNRLHVCVPTHSVFCLPVSVKIAYSP